MQTGVSTSKIEPKILKWVFLIIFGLLPFHAFLSTWLSSIFGYELLFKSWKEIVLILSTPIVGLTLWRNSPLRKQLFARRANQLILLYACVNLVWYGAFRPETDAAAAALAMNLRFLAFFVLAQILAFIYRDSINFPVHRILFTTVVAVGMFGVLQVTLLPDDFLSMFGYGPDTIKPYLTIDDNPDFVRINSTLRGPNPLGSYLILPIIALSTLAFKKRRPLYCLALLPMLVSLYASHSRSAWLGLLAAGAISVIIFSPPKQQRRLVLGGSVLVLLLSFTVVQFLPQTDTFKYVILHEGGDARSEGSSIGHLQASVTAADDLISQPFGAGPGTAGTASFYNESSGARLSENYFLQIGQQFGWIGLIVFICLLASTILGLMQHMAASTDPWAGILIASLAGLLVVNMLLHGFDDETTAMSWWGLAGLYYGRNQTTRGKTKKP